MLDPWDGGRPPSAPLAIDPSPPAREGAHGDGPSAGGTASGGSPADGAPDGPAGWSGSSVLVAVVLLVLSGAALFVAGLSLGGDGVGRDDDERQAVQAFVEAWRHIDEEYVGQSDPKKLLEGAISGMFETLDDPYSGYMQADEFTSTLDELSGAFEGIGARMSVEDDSGRGCPTIEQACRLRIVETLPDTPAEAAGLLEGDVVTGVDGESVEGLTFEAAVALIRGPRDSRVLLAIERDGDLQELSITRSRILSQDVRSALLEDELGYLRVDSFSGNAADSFRAALQGLLDEGAQRFVLDLRGDPGGYVDAAVAIASEFIAAGPVYWEEGADGLRQAVDVSGDGLATEPALELVALVDGGTASASEMLAGALQDAGRARLVGETTFGKGTIQEWTRLPKDSGGFRLSVAKWLTRDGTWINEVGIAPDVAVAEGGTRFWGNLEGDANDAAEAAEAAGDTQLQAAIEILLGGPVTGASMAPSGSSEDVPVSSLPAAGSPAPASEQSGSPPR